MIKTAFRALLLTVLTVYFCSAQDAPPDIRIANAVAKTTPFPKYLAYRHFLAYVDALDKRAIAARSTDSYQFAKPFASHAGLATAELDVLRNQAKLMMADLKKHDEIARATISAFRANALAAARSGKPIPPLPSEIRNLQRARTALLVHNYVELQTRLGPVASTRLDHYLDYEFVPHISMKPVAEIAPRHAGPDMVPPFPANQQ
ncbi:MAG TPA: hypothetical protein VGK64_22640 [Bryobacteraceae bacterium]